MTNSNLMETGSVFSVCKGINNLRRPFSYSASERIIKCWWNVLNLARAPSCWWKPHTPKDVVLSIRYVLCWIWICIINYWAFRGAFFFFATISISLFFQMCSVGLKWLHSLYCIISADGCLCWLRFKLINVSSINHLAHFALNLHMLGPQQWPTVQMWQRCSDSSLTECQSFQNGDAWT